MELNRKGRFNISISELVFETGQPTAWFIGNEKHKCVRLLRKSAEVEKVREI